MNKAVSIGMKRIKYSNDGKSVVYVYQGQKYTVKFEVESVTEGGLENFKYRTDKVLPDKSRVRNG